MVGQPGRRLSRRCFGLIATIVLALLLWPVAGLAAEGSLPACANSRFSDVTQTAPDCAAIHLLAGHRVINGYEDGSFRPGRAISRAEFAKLFVLVMGLEPEPDLPTGFSDVEGHWAATGGYIQAAVAAEAIAGFPDGTFRPDDNVTRAQALKIATAWLLLPGEADAFAAALSRPPEPESGEPGLEPGEAGLEPDSAANLVGPRRQRLPSYLITRPNLLNPQPLPPEPPPDIWLQIPAATLGRLRTNPAALNPQPLPPKELSKKLILGNPGMFQALNPQPLPPKELSLFELRAVIRGIGLDVSSAQSASPDTLQVTDLLALNPQPEPPGLPRDVPGSWYHVYVSTALELGLMGSDVPAAIYAAPEFLGDTPMTRGEAAMVLTNLLIATRAQQAAD